MSFLDITRGVGETNFKEIRFCVEPDFYFIGHKSSPAFGLSVNRIGNCPQIDARMSQIL
jgi:hypothetical protein